MVSKISAVLVFVALRDSLNLRPKLLRKLTLRHNFYMKIDR